MTRERVVLDTNVLVSGMLSSASTPARAVERAVRHGQLLASLETARELATRLLSPKFDRYVARDQRESLLRSLGPLVELIEVLQTVRVCRDPDDDRFLDVALNGRADAIVTGDRDLLALHPFRGIDIVTPAVYLSRPLPSVN